MPDDIQMVINSVFYLFVWYNMGEQVSSATGTVTHSISALADICQQQDIPYICPCLYDQIIRFRPENLQKFKVILDGNSKISGIKPEGIIRDNCINIWIVKKYIPGAGTG